MEAERDKISVTVKYKLNSYTTELPVDATWVFFGNELSVLTGVVLPTMRLFVPKGKRFDGSIVIEPASELYSSARLDEFGITSGVVIRMIGSTADELKEAMIPVRKNRILGFAEEEKRRRVRRQPATQGDAKLLLPKGPYTFRDIQVLIIQNMNPRAEKARDLLYKLANDHGIVAIMNKHKWRVGRLSELAPEGYVGISPKCILGQNTNRGEEISLRLRTDDLQGFRKYGSIKKTLLHELAHMVHDEHDEHFHALDKQLNQEAIELDWTNTRGRTLSGVAIRGVEDDDEPIDAGGVSGGRYVGGDLPPTPNARRAAIHAARVRFEQYKLASSKIDPSESVVQVGTLISSLPSSSAAVKINEPDPDEKAAADEIAVTAEGIELDGREPHDNQKERMEPDPDEFTSTASLHASLPALRDRGRDSDYCLAEPYPQGSNTSRGVQERDPDVMLTLSDWIKIAERYNSAIVDAAEPDPDESMQREEPDPDESIHCELSVPIESLRREEPDPDERLDSKEPGAHGSVNPHWNGLDLNFEPLDEGLVRILEAGNAAVTRLEQAVVQIRQQASPTETAAALNTLSMILSNLVNNPNEDKYKAIRKVNRRFQDQVGRFEGAVVFLRAMGFSEEKGADGYECFVLKTLDPGLLWLGLNFLRPLVT